jgi:hypothetical protein
MSSAVDLNDDLNFEVIEDRTMFGEEPILLGCATSTSTSCQCTSTSTTCSVDSVTY